MTTTHTYQYRGVRDRLSAPMVVGRRSPKDFSDKEAGRRNETEDEVGICCYEAVVKEKDLNERSHGSQKDGQEAFA
jgi:hypothetical protein